MAGILEQKTDQLCHELALMARRTLQVNTPNRWKGFLYRAVGNMAQTRFGYAVGGPLGPDGMLLDPKPAPKHTIRDFLRENPEFYSGSKFFGRAPPPHLAWRILSKEGKERLKEERMAGKFGGEPPRAPYWLIAEHGSASTFSSVDVGVPAIRYLEKSDVAIRQIEPATRVRVMSAL